ncbi:pumilio homolog 24 isoform X4 [Aegilops tauschii subsp. strangulata]|uniref:pumilio homolog 24 isoform X4 n=1 Tax=Aegilops tauschii subsp. strangulata TaxID=200361 RepID=UPI001ABC326B|nr:pumilio homolog 24 isoform X4 [Aegilops tauschii subsp. strangulata]
MDRQERLPPQGARCSARPSGSLLRGSRVCCIFTHWSLLTDRNNIIKSLKGKIMKLALSDYVCLFVVCLLSIVDNTKLVTEIIIEELTKQLKELTFDKNGTLLQMFHPHGSRYLTPTDLVYLNYNVASLISKDEASVNLDNVTDKEHEDS